MTQEQRHLAGDTGSRGISQIFGFRIYIARALGRELSFPQDVDGRGSGQPHWDWEPKAFKARALSSLPSCHQQMRKMQWESTPRAAGGSFLPLRSYCVTN